MLKRITLAVLFGCLALALLAAGIALAQPVMGPLDTGLPAPILEAWPILGLILGTGAVLLAAEVVKSAVQWLKIRLQKQLADVPHVLIHAINLTLSAFVGYLFIAEGRLAADPVFGTIAWPWNWLIFTVAVFWRAGGKKDEEIEATQELARMRR